ncbi:hypothetical protein BDQ17DRAFT_1434910 [Cyathus striatus]|nr:hypothetical protein BDQ17DRAFT_1434910 [Cyathus striatus]
MSIPHEPKQSFLASSLTCTLAPRSTSWWCMSPIRAQAMDLVAKHAGCSRVWWVFGSTTWTLLHRIAPWSYG